MGIASIPERDEIPEEHKWDLSRLFQNDRQWEEGLEQFKKILPRIGSFKGTLASSPEQLRSCLEFMNELGLMDERLGYYAHLRLAENGGDSRNQERFARYLRVTTEMEALASYQKPEILSIPEKKIEKFLQTEELKEFKIFLQKILRFKPYTLSEPEEKLLALQIEINQTPGKTFSALTDVDLDFGHVETPEGAKPLSQSTFSSFMEHRDIEVRRRAYFQFYQTFEKHKNTLASLYAGSVNQDIYQARVRGYPSSRALALFPDKVPESVYDNLIEVVNKNLDVLHHYYELRKKILSLETLHHYDVYVPLVPEVDVRHTYEEAVDVVLKALRPMGVQYCNTLRDGLLNRRWVDRYENRGKRSGAFSAGSYVAEPYILLNYKEDVLRDVFTLAHESGHSMHSLYSAQNNPFQHYHYSIFEAEVASTFNEQLLVKYLLDNADSSQMEAYLVGKQIDDIIATIYRQTMFAEFEHRTHRMVEQENPLTVKSVREEYRKLLKKYFGEALTLEDISDMEGLRIPHFYRAFYVYKYATGLSAAIALSRKVLENGEKNTENYLNFLKSGGSRYPIESLRLAGVDMERPEPIEEALDQFKALVNRMEKLLL